MVEEDRYCIDVLTQIEAAQAALNKIALGLVDDHVRNCMRGGKGASEEQVQELMGAVGRLVSPRSGSGRRRGVYTSPFG